MDAMGDLERHGRSDGAVRIASGGHLRVERPLELAAGASKAAGFRASTGRGRARVVSGVGHPRGGCTSTRRPWARRCRGAAAVEPASGERLSGHGDGGGGTGAARGARRATPPPSSPSLRHRPVAPIGPVLTHLSGPARPRAAMVVACRRVAIGEGHTTRTIGACWGACERTGACVRAGRRPTGREGRGRGEGERKRARRPNYSRGARPFKRARGYETEPLRPFLT